jgi:hypothetical protein
MHLVSILPAALALCAAVTFAAEPSAPQAKGARAVATFESIGLYWTPTGKPDASGCTVQYKKATDSAWKPGLNLWYDSRDNECRGSLVQLSPGTAYDVRMGLGSTYAVQLRAHTWSEQFPIARTITLPAGTQPQPLDITQGGSASGYVLYRANPAGTTIDVQNASDNNVTISAPYVIVRGLTLKGARINGIELTKGAHDVIIEGNDVSGWGRYYTTSGGSNGWKIGVDMDSGIRASCDKSGADASLQRILIQRNRIHDPRYGANSWSWGHPAGPQGITFSYCGGNHVIRYNEITSSDPKHYFNDAIGGEDNFSATGFPNHDTDIHGNLISGVWDDGIEAEGGNRNVRIWGNYLDRTGTGIASTVTHHGPLYIFRNVYNRNRMMSERVPDADDRGPFAKAGSSDKFGGGRRYVFHNTLLQAPPLPGAALTSGAGSGLQGQANQPLTNTVSRNNIWHIWKPHWPSVLQTPSGGGNDVDFDLYNGVIEANAGAEVHGIKGTPTYAAGHGWQSGAGGLYQLAPSSPGYDKGMKIPNFNDDYRGAAPDMGAHEGGSPPMQFGVGAALPHAAASP